MKCNSRRIQIQRGLSKTGKDQNGEATECKVQFFSNIKKINEHSMLIMIGKGIHLRRYLLWIKCIKSRLIKYFAVFGFSPLWHEFENLFQVQKLYEASYR